MAEQTHDEVIRAEFSKQAASFERPDSLFGDPRLMGWIRKHVPVEPDSVVLDVAGGTGHVARALAADVREAVVLDLTAGMLEEGRRQATAAGIENVRFEQGDAASLPYPDESFDLVISRFAAHHFESPAEQLREMVRVCRTGGAVAVIDLVVADPELAGDYNRLERVRDPSHTHALSEEELVSLLAAAGTEVVHRTARDPAIDVERWFDQAETPPPQAEEIRAELRAELAGGPRTGMRPLEKDGALHFTQRWAILVARK